MLKIEGISKKFKSFQLQEVNLEVKKGEYFMLLGKSGSGKSLLLEILAGMQKADSGKIKLEGADITSMDTRKRNIGLLFQDFAIFPHMNVFDNIAYSLKTRKLSRREIKERTEAFARDFEIEHLLKRKTLSLSGGEKQRVALARTLAMEPDILLLDEPLTSLDVQLRQGIRKLLRKINRKGQTVIHVTHDHEEAILLADRVAVINSGKIIQEGPVREVFHYPKNEFVANFTGIRNYYKADFSKEQEGNLYDAKTPAGPIIKMMEQPRSTSGAIVIRSRDITLNPFEMETTAINNFKGRIIEILPSIKGYEIVVDIGIPISTVISFISLQNLNIQEGNEVWVSFKASAVKVLND